jgi:hypothetical protein
MSTNVISANFKRVQPVKRNENVRLLPNLFSGLLNQYRAKQHEIKQKKIDFLTSEAYKYFYDSLEVPKVADVDLPEFVYEEKRKELAYQYTHKALLEVIANGRLNACYSARMKEIKNRG